MSSEFTVQVSDHFLDDIDAFRKELHSLLRKDDIQACNYVAEMKMVKYPGKIESLGIYRTFFKFHILQLKILLEQKVTLPNIDKRSGANTVLKKENNNNKTLLMPSKLLLHHVVKF